jgi:hypothetical protein
VLWWGLSLDDTPERQVGVAKKPNGTGKQKNSSREKTVQDIKKTVLETVKNSNGQEKKTVVKNKELLMSEAELESLINKLLDERNNHCAITGLPFQLEGDGDDLHLRPSLDRIDSDGHYSTSNVQLVCRFINFWKGATTDPEFRRLVKLVISESDLSY